MNTGNTLYAVLGVAADADAATVEAAYAARARLLHGDADALSLLRVAYGTLRDPARRAAYDRQQARRQLAPAAASPSALPAPRGFPFGRHLFVLAAAAALGFLLIPASPPSPPPVVAAAVQRPAVEDDAPIPLPVTASPVEAAEDAAPPPADAPVAAVASLPAPAPRLSPELPRRGAKQPGFDTQYVAWSVFAIYQRNKSGSGVLIAPDRILTNCHVLAGAATNGLVVVHSLTGRSLRVEKYARLDGEDACLLFAPGAGSDAIAWGSSAALRPGDTVHAMGHPGGSTAISWSEGTFRLRAERGGETFLISENYCRPGSSGGPLLDDEGRLVGIVTAVQRFEAKGGQPPRFGACISVSEATARALLAKPLFPIALAPAQYLPN